MSRQKVIRAKNIHKSYGALRVLRGIYMEVLKSEVIALIGASGAGKSTLLQIIGTLDDPDEGEIYIESEPVTGLSPRRLARFRNRHIGFVFQFHHLLPEFTALENVCIPALISGKSFAEAVALAEGLLERLGVLPRKDHKPSALSGGEQQRVAVARALINRPEVVLADEPSGNLDSANARQLHQLFFELRDEFDQTFVIATHNEELAGMCDRRLRIRDGIITQEE